MAKNYFLAKMAHMFHDRVQKALYGKPLSNYEMEMGTRVPTYSSPVDDFVNSAIRYEGSVGHFSQHYRELRYTRLKKLLEIFPPEWFPGKKVLELGSGIGYNGAFIADLGADVLAIEGRVSNINFAKLRYRNVPKFNTVLFDLDNDFTHFGRFDLIVNFAYLEVAASIEQTLDCCNQMTDNILLDTLICDSEDPDTIIKHTFHNTSNDNPLHVNYGLRPSTSYIEKYFTKHDWVVSRHFSADLNTSIEKFDWEHRNLDEVRDGKKGPYLRRFWHFYKNKEDCRDSPLGAE
jgi:SAM-dependent methyltransferase